MARTLSGVASGSRTPGETRPSNAGILPAAMPTYVYKFIDTGETIEIQQSFDDDALTEAVHPERGETMAVKKVFLPVGITFKGGGFYKTDSRKSGTKSDGKSGDTTSGSSDSSTSSASGGSSTPTSSSSSSTSTSTSSSSTSSSTSGSASD
jgi:predicted nucleic acid-binding Zn ribbon protein